MFDNELMEQIKDIYNTTLTDDGYVESEMDMIIIKRNGKWKLDLGYTSYYQAAKLLASDFMESLMDSMTTASVSE